MKILLKTEQLRRKEGLRRGRRLQIRAKRREINEVVGEEQS